MFADAAGVIQEQPSRDEPYLPSMRPRETRRAVPRNGNVRLEAARCCMDMVGAGATPATTAACA